MKFKKKHLDAKLPKQQNYGDAGYDLSSVSEPTVLDSGVMLYRTGVAASIPYGHVGLIFDRSGVSTKRGLSKIAGVIDSSFRGEIQVAMVHVGNGSGTLPVGDRIAQLVVVPCVMEDSEWVDELEDTARGADGFGSTG